MEFLKDLKVGVGLNLCRRDVTSTILNLKVNRVMLHGKRVQPELKHGTILHASYFHLLRVTSLKFLKFWRGTGNLHMGINCVTLQKLTFWSRFTCKMAPQIRLRLLQGAI